MFKASSELLETSSTFQATEILVSKHQNTDEKTFNVTQGYGKRRKTEIINIVFVPHGVMLSFVSSFGLLWGSPGKQ